MSTFKSLLLYVCGGAFAGFAVASLVVHNVQVWYNSPGGTSSAMCSCVEVTRTTMAALLHGQLVGMGVGGVAALTLALVLRRKKKGSANTIAATTPSAVAQPPKA